MKAFLKSITALCFVMLTCTSFCAWDDQSTDENKISFPVFFGETIENIMTEEFIENMYKDKKVSILGDSISTFEGYGYLDNASKYPIADVVDTVEDTWWYKVIDDLNMKLDINDSWSGTTVFNNLPENSGRSGPDICMASTTRISRLDGHGTPDVILFYGGTNDIGHSKNKGEFSRIADYAIRDVNLQKSQYIDFSEAYTLAIRRMKYFYPDSQIIALLPTYSNGYYSNTQLELYSETMKEICDAYKISYIDLRYCGISPSNVSKYLADKVHPNKYGMEKIANYVKSEMQKMK